MNSEKFDRVVEFIQDHPDAHNQSTWIGRSNSYNDFSCGTTGCIAGWAALQNGWRPVWSAYYDDNANEVVKDGVRCPVGRVGRDELELADDQADWMFDGSRELDDIVRFGKALKDNPDMTVEEWYEMEDRV